jgi:hypothetical protein
MNDILVKLSLQFINSVPIQRSGNSRQSFDRRGATSTCKFNNPMDFR